MSDHPRLRQTTLATVSDDKAFVVCRGDRITNINDLANCIESLTPEQFTFHVNAENNHFAQWIHDVLHNASLAKDLHHHINIVDQQHYVKTIRDHVHWLEHV